VLAHRQAGTGLARAGQYRLEVTRPQARCTSRPGVSGESPESSSASRARFHWLECFITAPATTSPRRTPFSAYLSTTAFSDAVSISWLPTRE
jgi:hypothetical protein